LASEVERLSSLPSSLRERVEMIEEALESAPHPFIYRLLMDKGTKHVIEEYKRKRAVLKSKNSLERAVAKTIGIRRVDEARVEGLSDAFAIGQFSAVGVDAGVNYLNLEVAYVPLCCAIAAFCTCFDVADFIPRALERVPLWDDEIYPEWRTLVISYRLQFELVREAVECWRPDVVFFDGPFLYSQLMRGQKGTSYWSDFERTLEEGVLTLDFCARRGVPVVGFVKRPEGCSVSKKLVKAGYLDRLIRDTVALKWMRTGYYLAPMRYVRRAGELRPHEVPSRMAEEYFERARQLGVDEHVVSIVFTYVGTGYSFPYKLEIPEPFADRLDELVLLTLALRAARGIPFPIYAADSLTKVTNTTRDLFLLSLRARLAEEVEAGRLSEEDLDMFLPRHGESYGLMEAEFERGLARAAGSRSRRVGGA